VRQIRIQIRKKFPAEQHCLFHSLPAVEVIEFGHVRNLAFSFRSRLPSQNNRLSRRGMAEPCEKLQQSRFAAAVWPQQGHDFSLRNLYG
jgi:hypothetical protein